PAAAPAMTPAKLLIGWCEILPAIDREDITRNRGLLRAANKRWDGPIAFVTGGSPWADHDELLTWWNGLVQKMRDRQQRQQEAQETVEEQHRHGRDATVLPLIGGHVHTPKPRGKKSA